MWCRSQIPSEQLWKAQVSTHLNGQGLSNFKDERGRKKKWGHANDRLITARTSGGAFPPLRSQAWSCIQPGRARTRRGRAKTMRHPEIPNARCSTYACVCSHMYAHTIYICRCMCVYAHVTCVCVCVDSARRMIRRLLQAMRERAETTRVPAARQSLLRPCVRGMRAQSDGLDRLCLDWP